MDRLALLQPEETAVYRIADVDVAIEASPNMLDLIQEAYRRFPRVSRPISGTITVRIVDSEDGEIWIYIGQKAYARIAASLGRGHIAMEIANAIITGVAEASRFLVIHAATVENEGRVVAIAGRSMTGKTLMTAHLLSRGWRLLSDDYAFVDPQSGNVVPFSKLLYMRALTIPLLPRTFRRAVERSSWYGFGERNGLAFWAVDPADSYGERVWSDGGRLHAILFMGSDRGPNASVEDCDAWSVVPELNALVWQPHDLLESVSRLAVALRGVRVGRLRPGDPIGTANAVEAWTGRGMAAHGHD